MGFFLVVPKEGPSGEQAAQLAQIVGANRLSSSRAVEVLAGLFGGWSLLEVPDMDPNRLSEVSRLISERLEAEGVALVDLDERLISLAELQEVASRLGLEVELVAVVKAHGKKSPPARD